MQNLYKENFTQLFLHQYVAFQLAQLFIHGNSRYLFPKWWNWQICHAHQAFKLPLCTFSSKLRTFPWWNQRQLEFSSIEPKSTLQLFSGEFHKLLLEKELPSGHYVAYSRVAGTCYPTRYTWLNYKYLLEVLCKMNSSVIYVCIASSFSRMR